MSFYFADVIYCSHFSLLVFSTFHILFLLILFKKAESPIQYKSLL